MTIWLWPAFLALICTLIVLDLGLLTRRPRVVTAIEALSSTLLWVLAAVIFSFFVAWVYEKNWLKLEETFSFPIAGGPLDGIAAWYQFFTSYMLEIALSLDNLAVMALVYACFKIPRPLLGRALFWSILVSLVIRLGLINGGAWLLLNWPMVKWAFGVVLVLAMIRTLVLPDEQTNFDRKWYVRLVRRVLPISSDHAGQRLFTRVEQNGKSRFAVTPMFAAVIVAGLLEVTFAADSVPALFSVTKDPFLAFSASALAGLGLRSLYFTVADVLPRFRFLRLSLVFILMFVAAKMVLAEYTEAPTQLTLGVVTGIMSIGVIASLIWYRRQVRLHPEIRVRPTPLEDLGEAVEVTRRNARKVGILIAGTVVVLVGIVIAPLPGPGPTVLVPLGLAILATEFVWAKWLLQKVKDGAFNMADKADALTDRYGIWMIPVFFAAFWLIAFKVIYGGSAFINLTFKTDITIRWYHIAVIAGSPFLPVLLWAWNYLRKYPAKRRAWKAEKARLQSEAKAKSDQSSTA